MVGGAFVEQFAVFAGHRNGTAGDSKPLEFPSVAALRNGFPDSCYSGMGFSQAGPLTTNPEFPL